MNWRAALTVWLSLASVAQPASFSLTPQVGGGIGQFDGGISGPAASSSYVGPGDLVTGAIAWWGLRAYNKAYATGSNPAIDIVRASDSMSTTINILATGGLDLASATTFCTMTTCVVSKIYDQTGNGVHLTQGTNSRRPVATPSCGLGSLPCMVYSAASLTNLATASGPTQAAPFSLSMVAGTVTAGNLTTNGTPAGILARSGANAWNIASGSSCCATTASDAGTHAAQAVFDASASLSIDGTQNTGSTGTNGLTAAYILGATNFTGRIFEAGYWPGAFSAGNIAAMNSNQHAYYGF